MGHGGILILVSALLAVTPCIAGTPLGWFDREASDVGFAFLKLEIGGRAAGMGGAYSAICHDATSSYWNPAGVMRGNGRDVVMHHNEHFQGLRQEFLGVSITEESQGFGLSMSGLWVDGLELRRMAQAEPDGCFGAYDFSFSLSYARDLSPEFALGLSLKGLHERIFFYTATGWALDIGGYYVTPVRGLSVGAVVQNLGPKFRFEEHELRLPNTYRLGLGYNLPRPLFRGEVLFTADGVKSIDSPVRANLGLEYSYRGALKLRTGYRVRYDSQDIGLGVGFAFGPCSLDYAYVPYAYDLGSAHLFTLGISY